MEGLTIRISAPADKEALMELAEAKSDKIHLSKKRERFEKAIGTPEMIVAEKDGKIAGFMYVYFKAPGEFAYAGPNELHISALAVDDEFQTHGIDEGVATALIRSILDKTEKPITTDVSVHDPDRISIFTNLGFTTKDHDADKVYMEYQPG